MDGARGSRALARLRGPGRRAVWRRGAARRLLAGLLVGGAAWAAVGALAPEPLPSTTVVVAARDIAVGEQLRADALTTTTLPEGAVPDGAFGEVQQVGGAAAGPVRRGEVITDVRLADGGLVRGLPSGTVLTHVPLEHPAMAEVAVPGVTVDVLSTSDGSVLAGGVTVVGRPLAPEDGLSGTQPQASGLYVAASPEQAARLATASGADPLRGGLAVVVHPGR